MLETHFKDDPASTNNTSHTHVLPPKTLVDKIYDPKRLDEAVKSFDPDKAAGPVGCALFYKPIWQLTVNERGHYADSEDTFLFKIEDSPDTRL